MDTTPGQRLVDLTETLKILTCDPEPERRGGHNKKADALSNAERMKRKRLKKKEARLSDIAVLDMETDPFDPVSQDEIFPFVACLHSVNFEPVVIWDENRESFIARVVQAIEDLPGSYTIYAHNGGKFDWLFLLYKLRGEVSFKGRGIMAARIGRHEIRDSYHIIPERLAAYQKDEFDYSILVKSKRNKPANRKKIIDYLINDCRYLLDIVLAFVEVHGLKLSIGQAAMAAMKAAGYEVERLTEGADDVLRKFFFGGRVECLAGPGVWSAPPGAGPIWKLYDVNSMYPFAMANYAHPICNNYFRKKPVNNRPNPETVFLELTCDNYGALVAKGEDGETTTGIGRGRFLTTIWEYQTALKYGLIENIEIHSLLDFPKRTTFANFVIPLYEKRQLTKKKLRAMKESGDDSSAEYLLTKKDDIFLKLILNNGYGRMAINPRRFREHYITDLRDRATGERIKPPAEWFEHFSDEWRREKRGQLPATENEALNYAIWERKADKRLLFHNVAAAASITGAARSILMEAIQNAVDPIYCDTDSLICRALENTDLDPERLGAWDLEDKFTEVVVAGKKLYACDKGPTYEKKKRYKLRSKGTAGMSYEEIKSLVDGEKITVKSRAPTINRRGQQLWINREVRATARPANDLLHQKLAARGKGT